MKTSEFVFIFGILHSVYENVTKSKTSKYKTLLSKAFQIWDTELKTVLQIILQAVD